MFFQTYFVLILRHTAPDCKKFLNWMAGNHVCDYSGCNSRNVTFKHRGVFCAAHLPVIASIRSELTEAKHTNDEEKEIAPRRKEILLRKSPDAGHVHYYNELVQKHPGIAAPL